MQYRQLSLSLLFTLTLAACGGGGGGGGGSTNPPPEPDDGVTPGPLHSVTVNSASGSTESRLACFKGVSDPRCNLRLYQVMVESFINGDNTINYNVGYGPSMHKGDLQGIINSLDYIKSTGVNALWLTPVFASNPITSQDIWTSRLDATGYFASDYFSVDPKFGTNDTFKTLVDEAHKRGLYVFMDGVFGHYKSNIVASPNSVLPANGLCTNDSGGTYTAGANTACANYANANTLNFFKEVVSYWITNYKVDGWRLDQGYQVPLSAWRELKQTMETAAASTTYVNANDETVNPLGYMVSEIWSGESTIASRAYGTTGEPALASAFDFPGRYRMVQTLATEEWGMSNGNNNRPASVLNETYTSYAAYPDHAMPNLMLGNHDLVRFGDLIQRAGLGEPTQDVYWQRHRAAFAFMAAHSGPITLYYGDEIGAEVDGFDDQQPGGTCANAGLCDDHVSRSNGKVSGLNEKEEALRAYVAQLMALRDANPALSVGSRRHIFSNSNVYIDRKDTADNHVLFVLNAKNAPAEIRLKKSVLGDPGDLTDLVDASVISSSTDEYVITLPPLSGRFLRF